MREELKAAHELAKKLPPDELAVFIGELETLRVIAFARITSPPPEGRPDELMDVAQAAKQLGVSRTFLYHHHKRYPFARRVGRKLLFSSVGLDSYLKEAR